MNSAYALAIATLVVSFALLANVAHAAPATHNTTDTDQGATCTGTGDTQTGECDTQSGDETSTDTSVQAELPTLEG